MTLVDTEAINYNFTQSVSLHCTLFQYAVFVWLSKFPAADQIFSVVATPTLFTGETSAAAKENWPRSLWVTQGKGHANQYTLYVPQVQVLQDIIDSSSCLVGALVREIHCVPATGFLAALNRPQVASALPFLFFFFLFFCSPSLFTFNSRSLKHGEVN